MSPIETTTKPGDAGVPRWILGGAAALVLFTVAAASAARYDGIGRQQLQAAAPVETLAIRFEDRTDGGVAVHDATDGRTIFTVAPGTNGFIRASLRGLVRERKKVGMDDRVPFELTRWSDGELTLDDIGTGRSIRLDAFGETNAQSFAQIFVAGGPLK